MIERLFDCAEELGSLYRLLEIGDGSRFQRPFFGGSNIAGAQDDDRRELSFM
jgi:hypothetical protein